MTIRRDGSRIVELLFPTAGLDEVRLRPFTLADRFAWERGEYRGPYELLAAVTGLSLDQLGALIHPDDDRVLEVFMVHVPKTVVDGFAADSGPPAAAPEPEPSPATNPDPGLEPQPFTPLTEQEKRDIAWASEGLPKNEPTAAENDGGFAGLKP